MGPQGIVQARGQPMTTPPLPSSLRQRSTSSGRRSGPGWRGSSFCRSSASTGSRAATSLTSSSGSVQPGPERCGSLCAPRSSMSSRGRFSRGDGMGCEPGAGDDRTAGRRGRCRRGPCSLSVPDHSADGDPSPPGPSCPVPTPSSSDRRFRSGSTSANACHRLSPSETCLERPVPALCPAKA